MLCRALSRINQILRNADNCIALPHRQSVFLEFRFAVADLHIWQAERGLWTVSGRRLCVADTRYGMMIFGPANGGV